MKKKDYSEWIGKKTGKLTVLKAESFARKSDGKRTLHLVCQCDCGNTYDADPYALTKGIVKSCGCSSKQRFRQGNSHGMAGTRFYNIWQGMLKRCNNERSSNFSNYGGRGIKVSEEWHDFVNFKNDMYQSYQSHIEKYDLDNTSIERKDVNGHYNKENCIWATRKIQNTNSRQVKQYPYKGEQLDLAEIARREGMNYRTLRARIYQYGWTLDEAISKSHLKWSKKNANLYSYKGEELTLKEISEREGIGYTTLYNRVKYQNLSLEEALKK